MYLIEIKDSKYTIPAKNLKFFTYVTMADRQEKPRFLTDAEAIKYLEKLGMKITRIE